MTKNHWFVLLFFLHALLALLGRPADAAERMHTDDGYRLGIVAKELPFDRFEFLGLEHGVRVVRVMPDSPADRAGLEEGDIIFELGEKPVYSVQRLRWLVSQVRGAQMIVVKFHRSGETKTVDVQIASTEVPRRTAHGSQWWWLRPPHTYLGVKLQEMTDDLRHVFQAPEGVGMLVTEITEGAPADAAGLAAGDVITKMDRKTIHNIGDVHRALDFFDPGDEIAVEIIREKKSQSVKVVLAKRPEFDSYGLGERWRELLPGMIPNTQYWKEEWDEVLERWREFLREIREYEPDASRGYL